jgi:hypothetical protein
LDGLLLGVHLFESSWIVSRDDLVHKTRTCRVNGFLESSSFDQGADQVVEDSCKDIAGLPIVDHMIKSEQLSVPFVFHLLPNPLNRVELAATKG